MSCVFASAGPANADITNTAAAQGTYLGQPVSSAPVTVNVPVASPTPAIGIVKTGKFNDVNGNGFADVNDTITYTFVVTNLGSVTLTNVAVTDNKIGAVTCVLTTLTPNQNTTCTGPVYHLNQADLDAGQVSNSATVTSKSPQGTTVSDVSDPVTAGPSANAPTVTLVAGKASMTVAKIDTLSGGAVVGNPITYKFTIKNTGTVSLHNITLSDAGATVLGGPIVTLAPGLNDTDTTTFTASHPLTAPDIAAGSFTNTATATATPSPVGSPNIPASGSATTILNTNAAMTFTKSGVLANGSAVPPKVGDKVNYTLVVTNTGATPLYNVSVSDLLLASAETSTQQMVALLDLAGNPDAASFATASFDHAGSTSGIVAADNRRAHLRDAGGLALADTLSISRQLVRMSGATGDLQAGEKIGVLYSITNSGKDGVSDISVTQTDSLTFGGHVSLLGAGETDTSSMIFTRELTPDDIASGRVVSNGYVSSTQQGHDALQAVTDALPLSGIKTYDDIATASISPASDPQLNAGSSYTFTAPYTLTQVDIDAGTVHNNATATATDSGGASLIKKASFDLPLQRTPLIGLVKKWVKIVDTNNNGMNDVGDVIQYQFTVYNLGNVTLNNINITDTPGGGATVVIAGGPIASMLPGQTSTLITGSYVITQADVDLGHVNNTATATGTAPDGTKVSHDSDPLVPTQTSPTVTPLLPQPQAVLYKKFASFDDVNNDGLLDTGDVIHYAFTVVNTGNVTLTNLNLTDALASAQVQSLVPGATLVPGASKGGLFTATYVVTAANEAAGMVNNRATFTAAQLSTGVVSLDGDPAQSSNKTTDTVIQPTPSIGIQLLAPSYFDTNGDGVIDAGDTLTYKIKVKNIGAASLNNFVLQDNGTGVTPIGTLAGTLLSGQENTTNFTGTHVLTAADIAAGFYNAQVKITANDSNIVAGPAVIVTDISDPVDYTKNNLTPYVIGANPQIAVKKAFDHFEDALGNTILNPFTGSIAVYKISVQNTGNVSFTAVTLAENTGFVDTITPTGSFALPQNTKDTTHIATHTVTNAEILAGQLVDQLTATAIDTTTNLSANALSDGKALGAASPQPTVVDPVATPSLAVVKRYSVNNDNSQNAIAHVGDTIVYSFQVVNTGNIDLSNVSISDAKAMLGATTVIAHLLVGASDTTTFTATHVVTPGDVALGTYQNQAIVTATETAAAFPAGFKSDKASISANPPMPTVTPLLASAPLLTKVAARSQVKRGDVVPFTITASNLNGGTYQLADIMPPGFVFVAGSAQVNGVVKVPVLNGVTLTFNNLTPTNGKIILTLNLTAQASLSGGQFVNNARLIDQTSNAVLAVAQATVEVIPEATFDCSDIIGRVFDDVSGDGYMRDGYKGLGGVRLATANGTLVITDAEGRFHIPCAAIPDGAIGSNFIMKIDPRTLPQGYKITTENPRIVRVTRGKMTEINFGATKIHQVKVDITGRAFDNGSADLTEKWSLGIDRLVDILRKRRSDLQIIYHQGSESGELAQARVDAIAGLVKEAFASAKGGYALDVNASVEPSK